MLHLFSKCSNCRARAVDEEADQVKKAIDDGDISKASQLIAKFGQEYRRRRIARHDSVSLSSSLRARLLPKRRLATKRRNAELDKMAQIDLAQQLLKQAKMNEPELTRLLRSLAEDHGGKLAA